MQFYCILNLMKRMLKTGLTALLLVFAIAASSAADRDIDLPSSGDRTEEITRVQNRLFDLGYYTYKPTGSFGSVTSRAIALFQGMIGHDQTGELTREEWDILFSDEAPLRQFIVTVPVRFKGQSDFFRVTGEAVPWSTVKEQLVPGSAYTLTNCATGTSCQVIFEGGSGHAEFRVEPNSVAEYHLDQWLGSSNSFYKIACLMTVDGKNAACSVQWDGAERLCVFFTGSTSHVAGLRDTEHETLIKKAAGQIKSQAG